MVASLIQDQMRSLWGLVSYPSPKEKVYNV